MNICMVLYIYTNVPIHIQDVELSASYGPGFWADDVLAHGPEVPLQISALHALANISSDAAAGAALDAEKVAVPTTVQTEGRTSRSGRVRVPRKQAAKQPLADSSGTIHKGFISHTLPAHLRTLSLPPSITGSAIISFFASFKQSLLHGTKTQTRRLWSTNTLASKQFLDRVIFSFQRGLFVRAWCGGQGDNEQVLLGYLLIGSMTREALADLTDSDVRREGCGGMTVKDFLDTYFPDQPPATKVWVVTFTFFPRV
jgi:hypothetical protein